MGRIAWPWICAVLTLLIVVAAPVTAHAVSDIVTHQPNPHQGGGVYLCVYKVPSSWTDDEITNTIWKPFHNGVYADLNATLTFFEGYIELLSLTNTTVSFKTYPSTFYGITGCFSSMQVSATLHAAQAEPTPTASAPGTEDCPGVWYKDEDGDGYTKTHNPQCESPGPQYTKTPAQNLGYDCEDSNPDITAPGDAIWCTDIDGDQWHGDCADSCPLWKHTLNMEDSKGGDCDDDNDEITTTRAFCTDVDGDGARGSDCHMQCHASEEFPLLKSSTKKDCNDDNDTLQYSKRFFFDGDDDDYPAHNSMQWVCANSIYHDSGTWLSYETLTADGDYSVTYDDCDDDPDHHIATMHYRDYDGDTIPYPQQLASDPPRYTAQIIPPLTEEKAASKGNSIGLSPSPLTISKSHGTDSLGTDMGIIDPEGVFYEQRGFCTTEEAQELGFVAHAGELTADTGDPCDAHPAMTKPTFYVVDRDDDGYADMHHEANGDYCLQHMPDHYITLDEMLGGDCDDEDPEIDGSITLYRDFDDDGFGDPLQAKTINCGEDDTTIDDYTPDEFEANVDGWVTNRSDLLDIQKSYSVSENIRNNPGTKFIIDNNTGSSEVCIAAAQYTDMIACMNIQEYMQLCESSFEIARHPIIDGEDLGSFVRKSFDRDSILACLAPETSHQLYTYQDNLYLMTNFFPLGKQLFALNGENYTSSILLDTHATMPITAITAQALTPTQWALVSPHIIRKLEDIDIPMPIAVYNDAPPQFEGNTYRGRRRIIAHGTVGPEYNTPMLAMLHSDDPYTFTDLYTNPLFYAHANTLASLPQDTDQDLDLLPDSFEQFHGMNPNSADSDGDGVNDAAEYIWSGFTARDSVNAASTPSIIQGVPSSKKDVATFIRTNKQPLPREAVVFAQAKGKAITMMPDVLSKLQELYGEQSTISMDLNFDYTTFISNATNASTFEPYNGLALPHDSIISWLHSLLTAQPINTVVRSPFLCGSVGVYGTSSGCGPNKDKACINLDSLKGPANLILANRLVNVLLHEALHHIIVDVGSYDPHGKREHNIIYDVIGRAYKIND